MTVPLAPFDSGDLLGSWARRFSAHEFQCNSINSPGELTLGIMTASLLQTVAQHEHALMTELAEAKAGARREIEGAHAAGAAHLQQTQIQLETAMAERRREAAEAREAARKAIEEDTRKRVSEIRGAAEAQVRAAKEQMLALLVPAKQ